MAAVLVAAALLLPAGARASDAPEAGAFKLVVHSTTAGNRIPRAVVAAIFLRQVDEWGDGAAIKVLDRSLTSPVRVAFGSKVLGMTTLEMHQYWIRQMSKGKTPPEVAESDEAVLSFVASTPGSISYVRVDAPTPPEVKVVEIE